MELPANHPFAMKKQVINMLLPFMVLLLPSPKYYLPHPAQRKVMQ